MTEPDEEPQEQAAEAPVLAEPYAEVTVTYPGDDDGEEE